MAKNSCRNLRLEKEEVSDFLEWLFADIARKPARLTYREVAPVVQYLRELATHGVPRSIASDRQAQQEYWLTVDEKKETYSLRESARSLAEIIWLELLDRGEIKPLITADKARRFLNRHPARWQRHRAQGVDRLLGDFALPEGWTPARQGPNLESHSMQYQGTQEPHVIDDLSARITAAAFAVKEVLPNRCLLTIADTLTRLGIKRKQNAKRAETDRKDSEWDSPAVRDRVRGYEKRFANWSTKERTALTRQWITAYRLHTSFANYIDRDDQRRSI